MRNHLRTTMAALAMALVIAPAAGEPIDGKKPILCVVSRITSCSSDEPCQGETPESINLPRFLRLDLDAKKISGMRPDGTERTTPIGGVQQAADDILLQGVDDGPLVWSLDITRPTGGMALTGIRGNIGFVIFGNCTAQ